MNRILMVLVGTALLLGACGGDNKVGSPELLKFKEGDAKTLGKIENETPAPSKAAPTPPPAAKDTPKPTAVVTATPAPQTVSVEINAQGYKPFNFRVFKGTSVKVTNADSQARSFTSDQAGVFDSGLIQPGGTFTWVANALGTFNFHDETRPFVVGQVEVVQR